MPDLPIPKPDIGGAAPEIPGMGGGGAKPGGGGGGGGGDGAADGAKKAVMDEAGTMAADTVAPGSGQVMKAAGIKPSEIMGGGGGGDKKEEEKGPAKGAGAAVEGVAKVAEKAGEKPDEDLGGQLEAAIGGAIGIAKKGMEMTGMDKGISLATDPAGGASKAMSAGGGDMPPKPPIGGGGASPGPAPAMPSPDAIAKPKMGM